MEDHNLASIIQNEERVSLPCLSVSECRNEYIIWINFDGGLALHSTFHEQQKATPEIKKKKRTLEVQSFFSSADNRSPEYLPDTGFFRLYFFGEKKNSSRWQATTA
jgi:hypothetical protein